MSEIAKPFLYQLLAPYTLLIDQLSAVWANLWVTFQGQLGKNLWDRQCLDNSVSQRFHDDETSCLKGNQARHKVYCFQIQIFFYTNPQLAILVCGMF